MDVALRVGDRVTMMFDGRIIVEGTSGRDPGERARFTSSTSGAITDEGVGKESLRSYERAAPRSRRALDGYYGGAQVLHRVRFEMGDESVAVVGRNGMGKTTLCNALMGFLLPPRLGLLPPRGPRPRRRPGRPRSPGAASPTCPRGSGSSLS